jgi:hypothetical protein
MGAPTEAQRPAQGLEGLDRTPLVDHHVHSVVRDVEDRAGFERFLTEASVPAASGCSYFDSFLGAALLHTCAPLLGLPETATADQYLERRLEVGGEEANRVILRAARLDGLLVDHGFCADDLVEPSELAELAAAPVRDIVRLEHLAEQLAGEGVEAAKFPDTFAERLASALSGPSGAVGCKSVLAYRYGLDIDPDEPSPDEVRQAVAEWLSQAGRTGSARVAHPVVLRHLVWAGIRAGVPLQFHIGYGDNDLELHRANPSLLTGLIRLAEPFGTPIMLLHCYPYHREAAYLASVYPHVYFDIGLAVTYAGYRAADVLAEALETAHFHKMLYSSDAFGLAELHYLGALHFRQALGQVLEPLASRHGRSGEELARIAELIGAGNARRLYGLQGGDA